MIPRKPSSESLHNRENLGIENAYLFLYDFDGTAFKTFEPSPNGVGVEENYENTLTEMFGEEIVATYHSQGGLQNRAPGEVIADLHAEHPEVIELAHAHLEKSRGTLESITPETAAFLSAWDNEPLKAATEVYIRQDLINSLGHIGLLQHNGTPWPEPCEGFDVFWQSIQEINEADLGFRIDTGIISSGYVAYIEKAFDTWGLASPDIMITDDQMRARTFPADVMQRVKPAPLAVAMAQWQWVKQYGFDVHTMANNSMRIADLAARTRPRIMYFGDSLSKDREMARRAHITFGHFDPSAEGLENREAYYAFDDWRLIKTRLQRQAGQLATGVAIESIMRAEIPNAER